MVCVCACMCVYECVYVYMHVCMSVCVHACVYECLCVHVVGPRVQMLFLSAEQEQRRPFRDLIT